MTGFEPPGPPLEPPRHGPPSSDPWGSQPYGGPSPYDRNRAEEHDQARRSKKMAGWALGLSFVWCLHPFTLLASVGLAIAALVRSGEGQEPRAHGRGMAIAAIVINALWIVLVVGLIATGGLGSLLDDDAERDDEGRVTRPEDIAAHNLRVGDCANDPGFAALGPSDTVETYQVEAVPCAEPHDFEVFHGFDLPDGAYPGEEAVYREADTKCYQEVRRFLGGPRGAARLGVGYYYPQEMSWRLYDDRKVLCVIGEEGEKTSGTLRGTGRR
jgi:hypothetical protein